MFKLFRSKGEDGFTIAELLIVIVVLGILAAIAIPSYTGLQKRARIAALESSGRAIALGLEMYKAFEGDGKYPVSLAFDDTETVLEEYIENYAEIIAIIDDTEENSKSTYKPSDDKLSYTMHLTHRQDENAQIWVKNGTVYTQDPDSTEGNQSLK
ncbi:MAG: prepilin-type N-terminal cleavage/methylation domain-containing protein [Limnochordia bacterium]|nr:prepilin-type N-terminal cleavage/methylation domain-containing protein [Limnochordia bacterium]